MCFFTRWTVRAECLKSVLDNYEELLMLLEHSLEDGISDTDMKARIIGVQSVMGNFDYLISECVVVEASSVSRICIPSQF